ncbi:MAG TPA: menaquinone biosynthesis protein [Thermoguttaceae bacterium]|nr:menaquinone biosynthesis protein [Thermoguttaceae bacterium]
MSDESSFAVPSRCRIGAVSYLNSKPLIVELPRLAPEATVIVDLPSRLADALAAGRLDVALVPSIELLHHPDYKVVSDACVSCEGPVRSVKLFSRVPPAEIRTLSLDEGSRTSAALVKILLREQYGLTPEFEMLPIGASHESRKTDAVLLIGDRAMRAVDGPFETVWDLGEQWAAWTGLPFVFAMWIARPGADRPWLDETFAAARDAGVECFEQIARRESPVVGISEDFCLSYLRDNLTFRLGPRQRQGLARFFELARGLGLTTSGTIQQIDNP